LKRNAPESTEPQFVSQDGEQEELEDGLKVWGYMPGHVHYKVGNAEEVSDSSLLWNSADRSSPVSAERFAI
jgi:REP element-mobilizing transposase RayT